MENHAMPAAHITHGPPVGDKRLPERFWSKVQPIESGCWIWSASLSQLGYGSFSVIGSRSTAAHRFAYKSMRGEIPSYLECDHLCRNRACVNPWHIELVTHRENIMRGLAPAAINLTKVTCKSGHPLTPYPATEAARSGVVWRSCRPCRLDYFR